MILRTRFALRQQREADVRIAALLLTIVRSRAPCSISASMSSDGMPAVPKPPIITVAPSWIPAMASPTVATILLIMTGRTRVRDGRLRDGARPAPSAVAGRTGP
jgi:hypothetical protein